MSVETKSITYEDYLALPATKQRYDIIDGEMIMAPAPTVDHQWLIMKISLALYTFGTEQKVGVPLIAPFDVIIQRDPVRTRQPDILFLSAERTGITGRAQLREMPALEVAPDLVIEILSPSNTRRVMQEKLADYQQIGVRECWLVSPEAETVEVLHLTSESSTTVEIFGLNSTLRSEVLAGFTMEIKDIFS